MAGYECTLPSGEVTRFSSMVRYYYLLDRESYQAIRCMVEPMFCNACQKIVEVESCVTEDDFTRHIESYHRTGVSKAWIEELALTQEFLASRVSGRKCLTCDSEDLVAIRANLDMMFSGMKYYAFLDKEGNGVPIEAGDLQKYIHGNKKIAHDV
jgi:hypothetical protein